MLILQSLFFVLTCIYLISMNFGFYEYGIYTNTSYARRNARNKINGVVRILNLLM